jgi:protein TonB
MHRDLTIGLVVSVLVHVGTLYSDRFIHFKARIQPKPVEVASLDLIEMPRIEPDEPDRLPEEPEQAKLDFVPPTQIDTPQAVSADSFVQVLQPPPPDRLRLNAGILDIPGDGTFEKFRDAPVFDPRNLDQIPQTRFQSTPNYPFEMRRAEIEGEVLVDFLVDTEGDVQNARALQSSHREFEAAAVQSVAKWKFRPGRKNGQNVVTRMQVPILFTLERR